MLKSSARNYTILDELNLVPRVSYLSVLTNPNQRIISMMHNRTCLLTFCFNIIMEGQTTLQGLSDRVMKPVESKTNVVEDSMRALLITVGFVGYHGGHFSDHAQ